MGFRRFPRGANLSVAAHIFHRATAHGRAGEMQVHIGRGRVGHVPPARWTGPPTASDSTGSRPSSCGTGSGPTPPAPGPVRPPHRRKGPPADPNPRSAGRGRALTEHHPFPPGSERTGIGPHDRPAGIGQPRGVPVVAELRSGSHRRAPADDARGPGSGAPRPPGANRPVSTGRSDRGISFSSTPDSFAASSIATRRCISPRPVHPTRGDPRHFDVWL